MLPPSIEQARIEKLKAAQLARKAGAGTVPVCGGSGDASGASIVEHAGVVEVTGTDEAAPVMCPSPFSPATALDDSVTPRPPPSASMDGADFERDGGALSQGVVVDAPLTTYAQQLLTAASNASNEPATFSSTIHTPQSTLATINGGTAPQKDFAIALGVSQARISQLVKIGMPLSSIAAAKDWRVKRQRSNDDAALDAAESAGPQPREGEHPSVPVVIDDSPPLFNPHDTPIQAPIPSVNANTQNPTLFIEEKFQ